MYVLQVETFPDSVVIGVYDTLEKTMAATKDFKEKNPTLERRHFFYDYKKVNEPAEWTNQQEAVWI